MVLNTNFKKKIKTDRLLLTFPDSLTFELAAEVYSAIEESKKELQKFLPWAWTVDSAEKEFISLKDYAFKNWVDKKGFFYFIRNKKTNEFLGAIDLMDVSKKNKSGEIGFWLKTKATGNGYMKEALLALEAEAFKNGFHRIQIGNDPKNIKSVNVTKNAGYHLDGVLRQNIFDEHANVFCDTNIWSKINPSA